MTLPAAELILLALAIFLFGWGFSLGVRGWRRRVSGRGGRLVVAACGVAPLGLVPAIGADYVSSWFRRSFFFGAPAGGGAVVTWWDILPIALAIAGILTLVWWRWSARAPKSPRCPRCQYDTSQSGLRCPECGHEVADPAGWLTPNRRRWPAFVALALLLAIYPTWAVPRVRTMGWLGAMPTTVMILGLPWWPESWGDQWFTGAQAISRTLQQRMYKAPEWQRDLLLWRARSMLAPGSEIDRFERVLRCAPDAVLHNDTVRLAAERRVETEADPQEWARWGQVYLYAVKQGYARLDAREALHQTLSLPASKRVAAEFVSGDPATQGAAGGLLDFIDPAIVISDAQIIKVARSGARRSHFAAWSLFRRAETNEETMTSLREIVGNDQDPALPALMRAADGMSYSSPQWGPRFVTPDRLRELLAHPDPMVATAALQLLTRSSTASFCREARLLRELAEAGKTSWIAALAPIPVLGADVGCRRLAVESAILYLQSTPPTQLALQTLGAISSWAGGVAFPDAAAWHERLDRIVAAYGSDPSITAGVTRAKALIKANPTQAEPPAVIGQE